MPSREDLINQYRNTERLLNERDNESVSLRSRVYSLTDKIKANNEYTAKLEKKVNDLEKTIQDFQNQDLANIKEELNEQKNKTIETLSFFTSVLGFIVSEIQFFSEEYFVSATLVLIGGLILFSTSVSMIVRTKLSKMHITFIGIALVILISGWMSWFLSAKKINLTLSLEETTQQETNNCPETQKERQSDQDKQKCQK